MQRQIKQEIIEILKKNQQTKKMPQQNKIIYKIVCINSHLRVWRLCMRVSIKKDKVMKCETETKTKTINAHRGGTNKKWNENTHLNECLITNYFYIH